MARRSGHSAIGLDLGARWVRAAQLQYDRRSGAARVSGQARLRRPVGGEGELLSRQGAARIVEALERQGFAGDRLVVGIPPRQMLSAVLEVPPRSSGAPLDVICRNELARSHRLEAEEIESAWWELPGAPAASRGGKEEGVQAVAVGCRASEAEALLRVFESAGARVGALDVRGAAMVRAVVMGGRAAAAPSLTAVLEWDWDSALIVVSRGELIVYERQLAEAGVGALHAEVSKRLEGDAEAAAHILEVVGLETPSGELAEDPELIGQVQRMVVEQIDSLALELRASAAYASRRFGGTVDRVVVCGAGAAMPGAAPRLEKRSEMVLEPADPAAWLGGDGSGAGGGGWSGATVLAAVGLAAHPEEDLA